MLKRKKNNFKNVIKEKGSSNHKEKFHTPIDVNDILADIISMIGVLSVDIFNDSGKVLYSYYRWGKSENILDEKELLSLIASIKKRLSKIKQDDFEQLVIRSNELNIVIYSTKKITLAIHCDLKTKLALLTIRAKRATEELDSVL